MTGGGPCLPGISIVMPAFNEEGNVGRAVGTTLEVAARFGAEVEAVVVDDGSGDGTAPEAERAGARVVRHDVNRGYGAAVRSGLSAAARPWIWLVDADNQFDPGELALLAPHAAAGTDLVLGYRAHRAEGALRSTPARLWKWAAEAALGPLAVDIDCAFKLMRTELVQDITLRTEGATVSAELLARARRRGASVVEVAVSHLPRTVGTASGLRPRVVARAVTELIGLRRDIRAERLAV